MEEVGIKWWAYALSLDREVKQNFKLEVCMQTGWRESTYYKKIKGGPELTPAEIAAVDKIYRKYKKLYG